MPLIGEIDHGKDGVRGDARPYAERFHQIAECRAAQMAISRGWLVDPARWHKVRDRMEELAIHAEDERVRVRANEALASMFETTVRVVESVDKAIRLDSGGVTERIGIDGLMAQSREEARRHAEDMARLLPGASPAAAVDPSRASAPAVPFSCPSRTPC